METSIWKQGRVEAGEVETDFLGDVVRVRLLKHALTMYDANQRAGTHSTKRRGDLHYRRRALFKQKGTGRARVRHASATQCRHGAIPMGPRPRDYSYQMPRRAKVEALRSALLSKFRDGEVAVAHGLSFPEPKTKSLRSILDSLGFVRSCLLVTHDASVNCLKSAANLRDVTVVRACDLNAWNLLRHRNVLITDEALAQIREKTHES